MITVIPPTSNKKIIAKKSLPQHKLRAPPLTQREHLLLRTGFLGHPTKSGDYHPFSKSKTLKKMKGKITTIKKIISDFQNTKIELEKWIPDNWKELSYNDLPF